MSGTQSRTTRQKKKQKNATQNEEKNQSKPVKGIDTDVRIIREEKERLW